jgi:hypothetical protein
MPAYSDLTTVYIPRCDDEAKKVRSLLRKAGVKFHNRYLDLGKPMPFKPVEIRVDEENILKAIEVIQKMVNDENKTNDEKK